MVHQEWGNVFAGDAFRNQGFDFPLRDLENALPLALILVELHFSGEEDFHLVVLAKQTEKGVRQNFLGTLA